jgi:hypothetical protein
VDRPTNLFASAPPEQLQKLGAVFGAITPKYAPDFKGMTTPEHSVSLMRGVISDVSIEKGHAGDFVSQFGNKQWL